MKKRKAIFGLVLSVGMLIGMNSMQKTTQANIGWGVSALFSASNDTTSQNVTGAALAGIGIGASVAAAAETGAWIGAAGGLPGMVIGGLVGAL